MSFLPPEVIREAFQQASWADFFPPEAFLRLSRFAEALERKNRFLNLTRYRTPEAILEHHLLDSAAGLPSLEEASPGAEGGEEAWLDLGTGAGFPGVVVAVARGNRRVTFLDAREKKVEALRWMLEVSGISGECRTGRAETLGHDPAFRESFQGVLLRAVAPPLAALELALPLVRPGGRAVFWWTGRQAATVDNLGDKGKALGGKAGILKAYRLPFSRQERRLWIVEKVGKTPQKYPRPWARIRSHPEG